MDISNVKDAFERVAKKQKLSYTKTMEIVDKITKEIEEALNQLDSSDQKSVLTSLQSKLNDLAPSNQLEASQKDLAIVLSKFVKVLEKHFNTDISKAYRNTDRAADTVNQIIAGHFYRHGMFEVGDCFVSEARVSGGGSELRSQFFELCEILEAMRSRNLGPALNWAASKRELLLKNGSNLELQLHSMQFVEILLSGRRDEALMYAKTHLAPFAPRYKSKVQRLMASILWAGRLDQSPYSKLASDGRWDELSKELNRQFCNMFGQSLTSPLDLVVRAGIQALPVMLKMAAVMAATNQDWQGMKQLPMPLDLGGEFQFHSIFVCPVLWEQASEENPPMLLPCGHVLCKQAVVKLSKNSARPFKCSYCPSDATVTQCRQLYL